MPLSIILCRPKGRAYVRMAKLTPPFIMKTLNKSKNSSCFIEASSMKFFKHAKAGLPLLMFTWGLIFLPLQGQVTPGSGNSGATNTPPSGNYPGSGSSPQPGVPPPPLAPSGPTPGSGQSGATHTPPSGNYPGSGSSPQPGVPPPPLAPSGPTPGSGQGGATNTPPNGVTPGSGTSPTPTH